jgi:hypothetical protein
MQALIETFQATMAGLACAVFAHFGVAVKGPCPQAHAAARPIPISAPARRTPGGAPVFSRDVRHI